MCSLGLGLEEIFAWPWPTRVEHSQYLGGGTSESLLLGYLKGFFNSILALWKMKGIISLFITPALYLVGC